MTYPRQWASFRTFGLAFAIVLAPALMQAEGTCVGMGDATLSALQFEVDGQNLIEGFVPEQRVYHVVLPEGAEMATITALSTDEEAEVAYATHPECAPMEIEWLPTGGGEFQLEGWAEGHSMLTINAVPNLGAPVPGDHYTVFVTVPVTCE